MIYPEALTVDDVTMCPKPGVLPSRKDAGLHPYIFSAPMDTVTGYRLAKEMLEMGEFVVIPRKLSEEEYVACLQEFHDDPHCFFAIGAGAKALRDFAILVEDKAQIDSIESVCVDIAHGDSPLGRETIKVLRETDFCTNIMCGSIATAESAKNMIDAGANYLRVGIGPGAACTTRQMTGVGIPQFTAVTQVHSMVQHYRQNLTDEDQEICIIADGGIKNPGQAAKYLGAGADAVMLGRVFSECQEAPGWVPHQVEPDLSKPLVFPMEPQVVYKKRYRGQASAEYQQDHYGEAAACPEGVSSDWFEWNGSFVKDVVEKYRAGLESSISYLGLTHSLDIDPMNVDFFRITNSGITEASPHGC